MVICEKYFAKNGLLTFNDIWSLKYLTELKSEDIGID